MNGRIRYLKHYTRLNILYKKGFDFGHSSFLTLTVQSAFKSSTSEQFHKAKSRLLLYLKRKYGLRYYLSVSEFTKKGVLHYHLILFNVPYIPASELQAHWGLGFVKINSIKSEGVKGAFYYVLSYISFMKKQQKHLRLVWSRSFSSDAWFSFSATQCVFWNSDKGYFIDYGIVPVCPFLPSDTKEKRNEIDIYQLLLSRILYFSGRMFLCFEEFDAYLDLLQRFYKILSQTT